MRLTRILLALVTFQLLGLLATGLAQEPRIYRQVTPEKLEGVLKGLNIDFKKSDGKREGVHFYDFERNNVKLRLHNYNGKDLWIDTIIREKVSLDLANRWNAQAKFSRAVLLKDNDQSTISLENQLDCLGGVTDAILQQYITRFDNEVKEFNKLLNP